MGNVGSGLIAAALFWAGMAQADCAPGSLDLRGPSGMQHFTIEIADTAKERAVGLMFREKMPLSAGMLFVYEQPQHARFWMKNTLIPLDMIFADASGTVTHVHENAVPQDLSMIDGGDAVRYVLEINGGMAKRMGIAPGAQMRAAAITQSDAVWPCSGE